MLTSLARTVAGLSFVVLVSACMSAGGTTGPSATTPGSMRPSTTDGFGSGASPTACPRSAPEPYANGETATVRIETAKGPIVIKVDGSLGPRAAANFVALAECGFYDGVVFHRLVPGFVIQGGDPDGTGSGGPGYQFPNDPVNVPYARGVVAMANAGRNTNGSQFFIVLDDSGLDPNYSVFGRVTDGMDTVDAIAAMPNSGGQENRALEPVKMDRLTVSRP